MLGGILRNRSRGATGERARCIVAESGLFDADFYVAHHPEAASYARSPLDHLIEVGLAAGHKPSRDFDPAYYFEMYPDVAASGQPALLHYIEKGRAEGRHRPNEHGKLAAKIEASGLFDADFYIAQHPAAAANRRSPLDQLIEVGLAAGHKPSRDFDPAYYFEMYPDVAASGQPALLHYIEKGRAEGRHRPNEHGKLAAKIEASGLFDADFYIAQHPEAAATGRSPLDHLLEVGLAAGHKPSDDFNPAYYFEMYPDVAASGQSALLHYIEKGRAEGRHRPNEHGKLAAKIEASGLFDADFYVAHHPEAAANGHSPLDHLIEVGLAAGHKPSDDFNPAYYFEMYPDVATCGQSALLHYIETGRTEGRRRPDEHGKWATKIEASGLFDADFYVAHHPEAAVNGRSPLDHLIEVGLAAGHKPSDDFNPAYYFEMYPDVAACGQSALLHYIEKGRAEGRHRPNEHGKLAAKIEASGLFDADFYLALYPAVAESGMSALDHFLSHGVAHGRRPSLEFDGRRYLTQHPDVAAAKIEPLRHYVEQGKLEGRALPSAPFDRSTLAAHRTRIAASGLLDAAFYLDENPVARDQQVDPILHYLVEGSADFQDPSAAFSTAAYLARNPDVLIKREVPLLHYLRHGLGAEPPPGLDEVLRSQSHHDQCLPDQNVTLARVEAGAYLAQHGFSLETSGPITYVPEAVAKLATRRPSLVIESRRPDVSIVIPVYGQMPFVLSCLHSLSRHRSRFSVEIIVADDASPAEHRTELLRTIPWIRYHRSEKNLGFLDNCNATAKLAQGRHLVLLNSDTWVVTGWLDELIGSFDLFPKAGFVGSKLVNADGTLQEAGGVYWSNGAAANYGRNGDSCDPRYNFARQVDWVSGASIAVPTAIWKAVDGFDEAFRPAYCEDVDLAFRIRERGFEVWYQPLSCVIHFEGKTHGIDETSGVKAYQAVNLKVLQQRWKRRLPASRPEGGEPDREANRSARKTMLVIDAQTHTPDRDAGSVIGWQTLKAFRELGFHQTYVPFHNFRHLGRYTSDYQRVGVQVLYSPFYNNFDDVMRTGNDFDYVLVHRYNIAAEVIGRIRANMPTARIIFVPVDLHHIRMERQALADKDRNLLVKSSKAKTAELQVISQVDCNIVYSKFEKDVIANELSMLPDNTVTLPWIVDAVESSDDQSQRMDIMFVGGFPHQPNVDAVSFFVADVWPLLVARLSTDIKFLAIGDAPPDAIRALASDRVVVTGYVPMVEPYFAQARVFVAPLRYGAGVKGKVIQALANGVPVVATNVAVEGIGLVDGEHCLVADTPDAIADAVLRLYAEPETWARLRESGLRFVAQNFSWSAALWTCERSLDVADTTWMRREAQARDAWRKGLEVEAHTDS